MDSQTITALTGLIVGVGTLIGGAVGFVIKRSDTRRQRREDLLIAHLTKQIEEINAAHEREVERIRTSHREELEKQREAHEKEVHRLRAEVLHERRLRHMVQKDATHWREQLIENHIDPDPADWTEYMEEVRL